MSHEIFWANFLGAKTSITLSKILWLWIWCCVESDDFNCFVWVIDMSFNKDWLSVIETGCHSNFNAFFSFYKQLIHPCRRWHYSHHLRKDQSIMTAFCKNLGATGLTTMVADATNPKKNLRHEFLKNFVEFLRSFFSKNYLVFRTLKVFVNENIKEYTTSYFF